MLLGSSENARLEVTPFSVPTTSGTVSVIWRYAKRNTSGLTASGSFNNWPMCKGQRWIFSVPLYYCGILSLYENIKWHFKVRYRNEHIGKTECIHRCYIFLSLYYLLIPLNRDYDIKIMWGHRFMHKIENRWPSTDITYQSKVSLISTLIYPNLRLHWVCYPLCNAWYESVFH